MSRTFEDLVPERRSQNPHMHLLEATLYLLENDRQNPRYLKLVNRLLNLFETKFLGNGNKLIREYLDQSFKPRLVNSFIIEPGHHYEWAWLLN
jgi:mannose-6-phosphate isomerase